MNRIEADVCIVGSGVAGAIVAQQCVAAGMDVVMVEAGQRSNGRAFGLRVLEQIFRDYRIPRMRLWHRNARYSGDDYLAPNYPLRGKALLVRGGTTLGWTGDAYRMPPEDFELQARTGQGVDWPIGYAELEAHYNEVETVLRIAGDHTDPGHPPRGKSFPNAPAPFHKRDNVFLAEFARHDIGAMHHNVAQAKDGSIFTGDELIDELERKPNFRLLVSTVAKKIECTSAAVAKSVHCVDTASGAETKIAAQSIVVCANGIESPNLLHVSKNQWWPDGLGNHSGHLGCHLTTHGGVAIGGRPRGLHYFDGPLAATAATRNFDSAAEQREGTFLLIWRPAPTGFVFLNAIFEHFSAQENTVKPTADLTRFGTPKAKIEFDAGAQFIARRNEIAERLEQMATTMGFKVTIRRQYFLAHHMCTTRMSTDPSQGVLDAELRVHSMENLYVCGGSSFASGGAANPTVTVAALAHRLGNRLAKSTR
jgi:choline dehydrogenase-like flavoprotein